MEEKFNKLDNFLREHLHDASENQAWNVPDDAIFERAMRTVAESNKKKRRGWILVPLLFGAALLVGEYIMHTREIKTLQGKITTLEDNLSRESNDSDPSASTSSNLQEGNSTREATTPDGTQDMNASVAASTTSSTQSTPGSNATSSPASGSSSGGSTSKAKSSAKGSAKTSPVTSKTDGKKKSPDGMTTNTGKTKPNTLPVSSDSEKMKTDDRYKSDATLASVSGTSPSDHVQVAETPAKTIYSGWVTDPLTGLVWNGVEMETSGEIIIPSSPASVVQTKSPQVYDMSFGLLLGANQSWLTMTNIPPAQNVNLHDYDNSQLGFSTNAFVNKPFSPKFSWQAGLGYSTYNNKSILEDQFLFDEENVMQMPDGQNMYQTNYDLVNPIGEYNMLLEFRVSDEMHENDVVIEYTTIEQTIHSVMLDLGIHYDLVTANKFKVSLGTGFGLGYLAGLKNEFNVSTYHNGILQENQMETPDHLNNVKKWYGQWLGNINVGYYPNRRMGIILVTQYNAGLTSIRDGGSANGPLTFLHAFGLSAGITHSF